MRRYAVPESFRSVTYSIGYGSKRYRVGDIIHTELEARYPGYAAQNTQTLFLGRAPAEYQEMFALQQEAVRLCYDMLRPGEILSAITDKVKELSNNEFACRILMHSRGLGDDSPLVPIAA